MSLVFREIAKNRQNNGVFEGVVMEANSFLGVSLVYSDSTGRAAHAHRCRFSTSGKSRIRAL